MKVPFSIARGIVSTILAVLYLLMSVASVTHELSHMAKGATEHGHASAMLLGPDSHPGHDAASPESKSSVCFFCAYNPMVLLVVAMALFFGIRRIVGIRRFSLPARRTISPLRSVVGLRAPPALG